jgi:hypothetical protein
LVLNAPSGRWQADHTFNARMASRRPRELAVSALRKVRFTTDWRGARLPKPVSLLLTSVWDLTGTTKVFARDDATGLKRQLRETDLYRRTGYRDRADE